MKAVSILPVLFLLFTLQLQGQDEPAYLNKSWKNMVAQIQRRNDVAGVLLIHLNEMSKSDSTTFQKAKGILQDFTFYLRERMTRFDSTTVRHVYEMNHNTNLAMGTVLTLLESQPGIRQRNEISVLLLHLEGTEKRLQIYRQQHNKLAKKHNRLDLTFYKK